MTVKQLIAELEDCDPDMEVVFLYDYGDYIHTKVAGDVTEVIEETLYWSDYHRRYKHVDPEYLDGYGEEDGQNCVVLA